MSKPETPLRDVINHVSTYVNSHPASVRETGLLEKDFARNPYLFIKKPGFLEVNRAVLRNALFFSMTRDASYLSMTRDALFFSMM